MINSLLRQTKDLEPELLENVRFRWGKALDHLRKDLADLERRLLSEPEARVRRENEIKFTKGLIQVYEEVLERTGGDPPSG